MRIGELARQSGITIPTIKYYVRAGLLPAGVMTAHNQAHYGWAHLRRLRLVDALLAVGGLTVAGAHTVLSTMDDVRAEPDRLLAAVEQAVVTRHSRGAGGRDERAAAQVAAVLARHHWRSVPAASRERLTDACAVAALLEVTDLQLMLDRYADAAAESAACDAAALQMHAVRRRLELNPSDPALREAVVVVAVLGAVVQSALGGIARQEVLARVLSEQTLE
jgi:DNA-binding transcriptional MerR regulator